MRRWNIILLCAAVAAVSAAAWVLWDRPAPALACSSCEAHAHNHAAKAEATAAKSEPKAEAKAAGKNACAACEKADGQCDKCEAKAHKHGHDKQMATLAADEAESLKTALKHLDAAKAALDKGEAKLALAELAKARGLVATTHGVLAAHTPKPKADKPFANTKCPIMGSKIEPADVPEELTRMHDGKKVAFCCGGCPAAWDKLSEEKKTEALRKAM